jgi:hypothetical protein
MTDRRRLTRAALTGAAVASLFAVAGGLYATTVVPLTDESSVVVGDGAAADFCPIPLTIEAGLARFAVSSHAFVIRDVIVGGTNPQCGNSITTVVGTDESGTPVAQGRAPTQAGRFPVPLDSPVRPDAVAHWHLVVQANTGDAGVNIDDRAIAPGSETTQSGSGVPAVSEPEEQNSDPTSQSESPSPDSTPPVEPQPIPSPLATPLPPAPLASIAPTEAPATDTSPASNLEQ